jgi:molybdopterin biosynthesis enzyme MoaB
MHETGFIRRAMMSRPVATIDESTPDRPRLVVEMPAGQREAIQAALEALTEAGDEALYSEADGV